MAKKFIPNGDVDFGAMARNFAAQVAADAARFEIGADDAAALGAAVAQFEQALQACRHGDSARSVGATRAKEAARDQAERIIRRLANVVRASERLDAATKVLLGIQPHKRRPTVRTCPQEPPRLRFVRALHESGAAPVHELAFSARDFSSTRPAGAVRLELFFQLVPRDAPIPAHPCANPASWPWYLQSYTRSPIRVLPPIPSVPMRIVYWGRWADSMCRPGPFSATAVASIEGGSDAGLPGGVRTALPDGQRATPVLDLPAPAANGSPYVVLMLGAPSRTIDSDGFERHGMATAPTSAELTAPTRQRRLASPQVDDQPDDAAAAA